MARKKNLDTVKDKTADQVSELVAKNETTDDVHKAAVEAASELSYSAIKEVIMPLLNNGKTLGSVPEEAANAIKVKMLDIVNVPPFNGMSWWKRFQYLYNAYITETAIMGHITAKHGCAKFFGGKAETHKSALFPDSEPDIKIVYVSHDTPKKITNSQDPEKTIDSQDSEKTTDSQDSEKTTDNQDSGKATNGQDTEKTTNGQGSGYSNVAAFIEVKLCYNKTSFDNLKGKFHYKTDYGDIPFFILCFIWKGSKRDRATFLLKQRNPKTGDFEDISLDDQNAPLYKFVKFNSEAASSYITQRLISFDVDVNKITDTNLLTIKRLMETWEVFSDYDQEYLQALEEDILSGKASEDWF